MQTTTKKPPTCEILYLRHSKARVVKTAEPRFIGFDRETKEPLFSKVLQDHDVIATEARKLRNK